MCERVGIPGGPLESVLTGGSSLSLSESGCCFSISPCRSLSCASAGLILLSHWRRMLYLLSFSLFLFPNTPMQNAEYMNLTIIITSPNKGNYINMFMKLSAQATTDVPAVKTMDVIKQQVNMTWNITIHLSCASWTVHLWEAVTVFHFFLLACQWL